jgi:membrane-bound lytic murein transglycosylase B
MKQQLLFIISLSISLSTFADYSMHKDSKAVIDELVNEYGFEESYVIDVLKNAKKRNEMLVSVANPAEKTKTWDDYKAIFIKKKRIRDGKKFINDNLQTLKEQRRNLVFQRKL